METEDAKEYITTVEVSAQKRKQLAQYEPAEASTSYIAEVPDDEDPEEVREALNELAWEATESAILERWEEHVRKSEE